MHLQRLEELHKLLLDPPNYVDFFWIEAWFQKRLPDFHEKTPIPLGGHPCGTSACAAGLACLHLPFQLQGLELEGSVPTFEGLTGYAAVGRFFGLAYYESRWLFDPSHYSGREITPQMVADRVRELLDQ